MLYIDGTNSDLEVLLSETAAGQIYQKWIDTLQVSQLVVIIEHTLESRYVPQARALEYQVRSQLQDAATGLTMKGGVRGGAGAVGSNAR